MRHLQASMLTIAIAMFLVAGCSSSSSEPDTTYISPDQKAGDVATDSPLQPVEDSIRTYDVDPPDDTIVPPEDVVEPPEDIVAPPEEVVEPPEDVVDPPVDVVEPPEDVVDPPEDVLEPPVDVVDPPEDVVEPPVDIIDPPEPVVLSGSHTGWKKAKCWGCHQGDDHNGNKDPYECVACHGNNGAPNGHSSGSGCGTCHFGKHGDGFPAPESCKTCHPK
jgi:hypothetical protein